MMWKEKLTGLKKGDRILLAKNGIFWLGTYEKHTSTHVFLKYTTEVRMTAVRQPVDGATDSVLQDILKSEKMSPEEAVKKLESAKKQGGGKEPRYVIQTLVVPVIVHHVFAQRCYQKDLLTAFKLEDCEMLLVEHEILPQLRNEYAYVINKAFGAPLNLVRVS